MTRQNTLPVPLEHVEQVHVIQWSQLQSNLYPELDLLYAVPNGGARHKAVAGKLRAEGVKSGVPDLVLPTARGGYFGMYAEMKRVKGPGLQDQQPWWRDQLIEQGYHWVMFRGAGAAYKGFLEYLKLEKTQIIGERHRFDQPNC